MSVSLKHLFISLLLIAPLVTYTQSITYWDRIVEFYYEGDCAELPYNGVGKIVKSPISDLRYDTLLRLLDTYKTSGKDVEFIVIATVENNGAVNGIRVRPVGEERKEWHGGVERNFRKLLTHWPACRIPIAYPDERWSVVLPYSLSINGTTMRQGKSASAEMYELTKQISREGLVIMAPIFRVSYSIVH